MRIVCPPPATIAIAHPCPACRGQLEARRCPTAHRRMLICACGWRGPLPEALKLRLAGYKELFDMEKADEQAR
jgi:hypothetical protein